MKEKLTEILGLNAAAADDEVVAEVASLKKSSGRQAAVDAREAKIRAKMAQSGGSLNRENAILALKRQGELDQ